MKPFLVVVMAVTVMVTEATVQGTDCPVNCTYEYLPVCGSDGYTYPNLCVLNMTKACYDPDLTLAHKGECQTGEECPYGCTDEYDPVCGSDGKTYANMCELNVTQICYKPDLTLSHRGECEETDVKCGFPCPDNYDPVCGSDGHTYGNLCELESVKNCSDSDLTVAHLGECNNCPVICTANYDPVCGSDGKTYSNMCELEGEKKCHNSDLSFVHKGECGKECPYSCPYNYDPVCGSDGLTYPNLCVLNITQICYDPDLTLDHEGQCHTPTESDCPNGCYDNWDPVCGSDGNTYGNLCMLEEERECGGQSDLVVDHIGVCAPQ